MHKRHAGGLMWLAGHVKTALSMEKMARICQWGKLDLMNSQNFELGCSHWAKSLKQRLALQQKILRSLRKICKHGVKEGEKIGGDVEQHEG